MVDLVLYQIPCYIVCSTGYTNNDAMPTHYTLSPLQSPIIFAAFCIAHDNYPYCLNRSLEDQ